LAIHPETLAINVMLLVILALDRAQVHAQGKKIKNKILFKNIFIRCVDGKYLNGN
jgi:hypothetical protein